MSGCSFDPCQNPIAFCCNCSDTMILLCKNHLPQHLSDASKRHTIVSYAQASAPLLFNLKRSLHQVSKTILLNTAALIKSIKHKTAQDLLFLSSLDKKINVGWSEEQFNNRFFIQALIDDTQAYNFTDSEGKNKVLQGLNVCKQSIGAREEAKIDYRTGNAEEKGSSSRPESRNSDARQQFPHNEDRQKKLHNRRNHDNRSPNFQSTHVEKKNSNTSNKQKIKIPDIPHSEYQEKEKINAEITREKWYIRTHNGDKELPSFVVKQIKEAQMMNMEFADIYNKGRKVNRVDLNTWTYYRVNADGSVSRDSYQIFMDRIA
jgi:hypothetical protein